MLRLHRNENFETHRDASSQCVVFLYTKKCDVSRIRALHSEFDFLPRTSEHLHPSWRAFLFPTWVDVGLKRWEGEMPIYEVEILNWEKYNPRADQKRHSWFRKEAAMIYHPAIQKLSHPGYRFWDWLLSERTHHYSTTIRVDTDHVVRMIRVRADQVLTTLVALADHSLITFDHVVTTKKRPLRLKASKPKSGETCALRTYERTYDTDDTDGEIRTDDDPENKKITPKQFVELWNTHCGKLPQAMRLTESRADKIRTRLRETADLGYWETAIKKLAASEFCQKGKWATIDWLVDNDTNHVKAAEGKYDDRAPEKQNGIHNPLTDPLPTDPEARKEAIRKRQELQLARLAEINRMPEEAS